MPLPPNPTSPAPVVKFSAYSTVSIFSALPLHVECITGYDDHLLVGTNKGHLLIYEIAFKTPPEINLTHSNKYFSRKPILQLDVIPEHKILICLTAENGITIHDMSVFNCAQISAIEKTKGAHAFVLDIVRQTSLTGDPSITVRMCVVVGKRLQFFYWKRREFHELRDDFSVPDIPKAVSWCKETLCLAFKSEYCLISLIDGKQEELFSTSKQGEPHITRVGSDMFALAQDKKSVLISTDRTREMQVVNWSDVPSSLVYDEPYLVAIVGSKLIEVRTLSPKIQIDSFQLAGAKIISRTKCGHIYAASSNSIWCLKSTPIETQIESLIKHKQFELALSLANTWDEPAEERKKQIDHIQKLYGLDLFCNKSFEEAMTIFTKLETDVSHVIGLFPDLLPFEFRNKLEYPVRIPQLEGIDLEKGLTALIQFLIQSRRTLLASDTKSKGHTALTPTASLTLVEGISTIKSKKQLLQIIDTSLLKCYLQTNESLVASLLRLKENYCHLEETERALRKHGKLNELIIMYQSRGLHRKALEFIVRQNKPERIISYLQHLGRDHMDLILEFSKPVLQQNPTEGIKIFIEDTQEIESLPRPRVYDFLLNNFKETLVTLYLEHVIHAWNEKNALFHNALINQYREKLLSATTSSDEKDEIRKKLLIFLKSSNYYTPEHVLVHFPYDDMFEERALILERLGRHEQALSIYTTILKDMDKAIDYCKKVYEKNDPTKREVFTILMRMLLNPPTSLMPGVVLESEDETKEPDLASVVMLLHEYAPYIEPFKALKCLPEDIEINQIQNFLRTSIQNHFSEKRKLLIKKGLAQSENLRACSEKIQCESECFKISEQDTSCAVCKKRFANQSAFVRYPDGSIVHFSCQGLE